MIPDPLHPAIVHFPIVLALLAPVGALVAAWGIASGRVSPRAWMGVVVLQIVLVASGWLTLETGEREEERVERVVAERHIEDHEEEAERFLLLAALTLPLAAAGLMRSAAGTAARGITVLAAAIVAAAVGAVGHSGGALVYQHGAAQAYTQRDAGSRPVYGANFAFDDHDEHGDRDEHGDHGEDDD
ncbi:MAG: DUF2231 domain-containing protein [Myxococcota bacterium]